jgi:hypothetical protein
MPSTFDVHQALALEERGLFALCGEIRDGMVQTGMVATLADDQGRSFEERVHSVEYLDLPGAAGLPTLTFHYRDPAKLDRWMALGWEGETLSLHF